MRTSPDGSLVDRVRMHAGVNNGRVGGNDFNFQMSDVAAAILRAQLPRFDEVRRARRELAARFAAACPRQLETLWNGHDAGRLWYRFIVLADSEQERERLIAHFRAAHICADGLLRKPQLLHRILGLDPAAFPRAERWAERIVSIPLHPSLTSTEVRRIEDALSDYRP